MYIYILFLIGLGKLVVQISCVSDIYICICIYLQRETDRLVNYSNFTFTFFSSHKYFDIRKEIVKKNLCIIYASSSSSVISFFLSFFCADTLLKIMTLI